MSRKNVIWCSLEVMKIENTSTISKHVEFDSGNVVSPKQISVQGCIGNRASHFGRAEAEDFRLEKKILYNNRTEDLKKEGCSALEILTRGIAADCREFLCIRAQASTRQDEDTSDSIERYKESGCNSFGDGLHPSDIAERTVQECINKHPFDEKIFRSAGS